MCTCFDDHMLLCLHALMFTFFYDRLLPYLHVLMIVCSYSYKLWREQVHQLVHLNAHMLEHFMIACSYVHILCWSHAFMFKCVLALMITCFYVYMFWCSHAFMFTCFDDCLLPCLHALTIVCSHAYKLWWEQVHRLVHLDVHLLGHFYNCMLLYSHALLITCFYVHMPRC